MTPKNPLAPDESPVDPTGSDAEAPFRVEDRRHWVDPSTEADAADQRPAETRAPSIIEEYRARAEAAEGRLQEYIDAFKRARAEQEEVRVRLARDVDRRTDVRFGELVTELLDLLDNLELALDHARQSAAAESLVRGIDLARKRFLDTLEAHGVQRFGEAGAPFDPNEAEAVRVDAVDTPEKDDTITEILRPGYRLGDRVLRAARVAVGRHAAR